MTHQPPGGFANHSANSITARIDDRILRYSDNRILERLEAYHTDRIDIHLLNLRKIFANAWWMQAFTEDAVIASAATRSMPRSCGRMDCFVGFASSQQ